MNVWQRTVKCTTPDTWIGVILLVVAVVYWWEASKIRTSALDDSVGASGLPKSLAYVLGGLAMWLIIRSIYAAKSRILSAVAEQEDQDDKQELADWARPHLRALGMLAIGVGYLLLLPYFGYALSIVALLLVVSLYNGARLNLRTILVAVVGGVVCHLLFVEFLGIAQPQGELSRLIAGGS